MLEVPDHPEELGPWPVGARTASIGRLSVEVWYPAEPGSTGAAVRYDLREWLPASQRSLISDAENPWQDCDCSRDLPIDAAHGPYPVLVFVHGTAGFRSQSLSFLTHWASRGFVVLATEHPGLFLADMLGGLLPCEGHVAGTRDLRADVAAMLDALDAPEGDLAFLAGRVDPARVGLVGHSAGGAVAEMTDLPGVRVVAGLSSGTEAAPSASLLGTVMVRALEDRVVRPAQTLSAYEGSPEPRWLLDVGGSGHLAPSDLCDLENADGQNLLEVAQEAGVCNASFAGSLFDCRDTHVDPAEARAPIRALTTAVLEHFLQCRDRLPAIAEIPTRIPHVAAIASSP